MKEFGRVVDFDSGDTNCVVCNKVLHLFYNGGTLDSRECCGYTYRTENIGVDLVIYNNGKGE